MMKTPAAPSAPNWNGSSAANRWQSNLPESQVVAFWHSLLETGSELVTESGEVFSVVYAGRPNDTSGGDVTDAVINYPGGRRQGKIEFHVHASDWYHHRHHHDPAYQNVILHVVMWDDTAPIVVGGRRIPTLSLHKYISEIQAEKPAVKEPERAPEMPCRQQKSDPVRLAAVLDSAGDARFREKATRFQQELGHREAAQILYRGIMEALGYTRNKEPCRELADRVPLAYLTNLEGKPAAILLRQQAVLLGTAGLLPALPQDRATPSGGFAGKLADLWQSSGNTTPMSAREWDLYKVRPNNAPVRRLAAVSYLMRRYRRKTLLNSLTDTVKNISTDKAHVLSESLQVAAEGYWREYLDFTTPCRGTAPALIGGSRAAEIVINAVLPFLFARGQVTADAALSEKSLALYTNFPALPANAIVKHLATQLGITRKLPVGGRRQQGLLYLYKNLCTQGKCGECPVVE